MPAVSDSSGKVAIVTGANCGIGFEACKLLGHHGYEIVMACRDESRANEALLTLKKDNPTVTAVCMQVDLANMVSVRKFVDEFHASGRSLHLLVNNAGMCFGFQDTTRRLTDDGFEVTIASNYLGHFLLTNLLLDDLKKSASQSGEARVVMVSSSLHNYETANKGPGHGSKVVGPMELENFMLEREQSYSALQAYKDSKAALVMFTHSLSGRLEGTGVTTNAVCPGFIPRTKFIRHSGAAGRFFLRYVLDGAMKWFRPTITRSPEEGGRSIFNLAVDDKYKGVTGKFYKADVEEEPHPETKDEDTQRKLWELSAKLTKL